MSLRTDYVIDSGLDEIWVNSDPQHANTAPQREPIEAVRAAASATDAGGDGTLAAAVADGPGAPQPEEVVEFQVQYNTILGTWGQDDVLGTNQADYIATYLGNDTINGLDGNDVIVAGFDANGQFDDADDVNGGAGLDQLWGGGDGDTLIGNGDGDLMWGGEGGDLFVRGLVAPTFTQWELGADPGFDDVVDYQGWMGDSVVGDGYYQQDANTHVTLGGETVLILLGHDSTIHNVYLVDSASVDLGAYS